MRQLEATGAFRVVAEAADVEAGRRAIEAGKAAFAIFDLKLRDGSTIPLISVAIAHDVAVLVLTVWDDDESVYDAIAAGAGGYVLKGDASTRIAEALTVLKNGGAPISPTIARRLLEDLRLRAPEPAAPQPPAEQAKLTDREREIIELFAKGATYDEVAGMLAMSVNTVRHHVRGMYKKLHVCSKTEAVTMAYRLA